MDTFGSTDTAIILAMVVGYIIFTSWLTYRLRSTTNAQFMTASRSLPAAVVGVLLMSEFVGAKSTIGTAQEAFSNGLAASWSVLGASIGFVLFGLFFVRRLYGSGEYTISAAIAQKYGRSTMLTVSLIMIYALLLVNVGNYISGAAAIATVMKVSLPQAMVMIAFVSTFYYVFGGLKGVAYVTVLHSAIKLIGVGIILAVALYATGGVTPMVNALPAQYFTWDGAIGGSTIVAWTIGTIGAIFSTQFIMQAISSCTDANQARRASFYSAALCFPLGIALALIGVAAKVVHPEIKSLFALPVFLQGMNPLLAGLVTTALVASVFVSVCTVALAIVSLVMRDFLVPWLKPQGASELRMTRIVSLVVAFVPLIFVFFVPEILKLSFFTRALRLSISIVALIGFYLPMFRSSLGATLGLLASAVATSVWYILGNPFGIDNMYVAAATPIVVMLVERAVNTPKTPVMSGHITGGA